MSCRKRNQSISVLQTRIAKMLTKFFDSLNLREFIVFFPDPKSSPLPLIFEKYKKKRVFLPRSLQLAFPNW